MKRWMEVSQHCWKFIYKHSDISIFAVTYFFFIIFIICTGVGKKCLQINSAAVAFIDILIAPWEGLWLFQTILQDNKTPSIVIY